MLSVNKRKRRHCMPLGSLALMLGILATATAIGKPPARRPAKTPKPTVANFAYGDDSPRQVLDFWQAPSEQATPVVVFIHGGGWTSGDKRAVSARFIQQLTDAGISVASISYRLIQDGMAQGVKPPVKACVYDAARAVQTIRAHAQEWNIDPQRIAAAGSSAGACTSLWLAMHDDLADPNAADPVARQSTRLTCAAVDGAQTSLDPRQVRQWIPNAIYGGHAFGFRAPGRDRKGEFELLLAHREEVLPWIKEYSPIELASRDDPPLYLRYVMQEAPPVLGQAEPNPTHSALYGLELAKRVEPLGVEIVVTYPGKADPKYGSPTKFLIRKLKSTSSEAN
jgi:acetyl esterase/lipase